MIKTLKTPHQIYGRKTPGIETGPGLTEQSHKNECDMNYILADYHRTGLLKHAKQNEGRYDDVTSQDFQEAMIIVANANSMFNELPADMRKKFHNQPAQFLEFVQNPENAPQMARMGILKGNDGLDINGAKTTAPTAPQAPKPAESTPTAEQGAPATIA